MRGQCIHCEYMSQKNSSIRQHYICPECDFLMESQSRDKAVFMSTF